MPDLQVTGQRNIFIVRPDRNNPFQPYHISDIDDPNHFRRRCCEDAQFQFRPSRWCSIGSNHEEDLLFEDDINATESWPRYCPDQQRVDRCIERARLVVGKHKDANVRFAVWKKPGGIFSIDLTSDPLVLLQLALILHSTIMKVKNMFEHIDSPHINSNAVAVKSWDGPNPVVFGLKTIAAEVYSPKSDESITNENLLGCLVLKFWPREKCYKFHGFITKQTGENLFVAQVKEGHPLYSSLKNQDKLLSWSQARSILQASQLQETQGSVIFRRRTE
ncbi:hypothetical protein F5Y16DRAFT_205403 [Xylariaceae sp. FL0255]|nr:hypothetical protein F5Y16DRAFT_205403 [Xylariaceae sp. FL0255]